MFMKSYSSVTLQLDQAAEVLLELQNKLFQKLSTLKEENFVDRSFCGFVIFDPFHESLCPRMFSKLVIRQSSCPQNFSNLVIYEILFSQNLKPGHTQKSMIGKC